MIWALVHHPTDSRAVFAGFGNVARGHASGAGGAGDLMISRDLGNSWERLDIELPGDRVLWQRRINSSAARFVDTVHKVQLVQSVQTVPDVQNVLNDLNCLNVEPVE